jgi:hypothetical protein
MHGCSLAFRKCVRLGERRVGGLSHVSPSGRHARWAGGFFVGDSARQWRRGQLDCLSNFETRCALNLPRFDGLPVTR